MTNWQKSGGGGGVQGLEDGTPAPAVGLYQLISVLTVRPPRTSGAGSAGILMATCGLRGVCRKGVRVRAGLSYRNVLLGWVCIGYFIT